MEDIKKEKNYFEEYSEYDFLYVFGIGNGVILKELLKNKKHQQIVIIEPNMELLYIASNLHDFSKEILSKKMILINTENLDFYKILMLIDQNNANLYARVYKLHILNNYYDLLYAQEIKKINDIFIRSIKYHINVAGNCAIDQMTGLKQHLMNIPRMLNGPKFNSLKTKKNADTAIVVSTGPSLHKQLRLLKEIENHVTIISVDASMPVLEEHAIKPDFVVSMERDEISDIFHKKTSIEFQEDINFICASVQNKKVLKAIKRGSTTIVMRPFEYNAIFSLDDYGYVCTGMSSANMAYELALFMEYKKIIFIGQDLAYGKDGASHSKGHVLGADFIKDGKMNNEKFDLGKSTNVKNIKLQAYGGEGYVESTYIWELFLNGLEQFASASKQKVSTINATEGGARISNMIELPFKDAINQYVNKSIKKNRITLENTEKKDFEDLKTATDKKVLELIEEGEKLQEKIEKEFIYISEKLKKIENKNEEEIIDTFDTVEMVDMLDRVNTLRDELSNNEIFTKFYHNLLQSIVVNYETELAEIKVTKVHSQRENQLKAIKWVMGHRTWMFDLAGGVWNVLEILKNDYAMEPC